MGIMDDAVEDRVGKGWIAEHLRMPHRLTGESLKSGSLIRTTRCTASAFLSASDVRGGDAG
jgi:hypothetical protein